MGAITSSVFEATRLGLARLSLEGAGELRRGLERATQTSAGALGVARVGVWFFTAEGDELVCASLYELEGDRHSAGQRLSTAEAPAFRHALESRRVVSVDDARTAPETRELRAHYLDRFGITSLVGAPVFRLGDVVGVLSHEHVGAPRQWTPRERELVASVANLLAVLLEQATRMDVEAALRAQRERLAKAEKLEALSRLSAGVAHDFNNVLGSLQLGMSMLRRERQADAALVERLSRMIEVGERGTRIVQQLLAFCRETPGEPRPLDVTRSLGEMRPLLGSLLGKTHTLRLDLPAERLVAHLDPAHLDQLTMNLVINAREAMPDGGEVHVALRPDGDTLVLTVSDRGTGIEPSLLPRIFEPFFTTKGHGTGLGLATVHGIVEDNGGTIEVDSVEGRGTTFSVRLPRTG